MIGVGNLAKKQLVEFNDTSKCDCDLGHLSTCSKPHPWPNTVTKLTIRLLYIDRPIHYQIELMSDY